MGFAGLKNLSPESSSHLSKRTLQEVKRARPNENGRVSETHLSISFDKLYVWPWDIGPGPGNTTGIQSTCAHLLTQNLLTNGKADIHHVQIIYK